MMLRRTPLVVLVALLGVGSVAFAGYRVLSDRDSGDAETEAAGPGSGRADESSTTTSHAELSASGDQPRLDLYPDRPNRREEDREAALGEEVSFGPLGATVERAAMERGRGGEQLLVVFVSLVNSGDSGLPYRDLFFAARAGSGERFSPARSGRRDALEFGQVPPGETIEGTVAFEVKPGVYFVEFQPDPFSEARAVWRVVTGDDAG